MTNARAPWAQERSDGLTVCSVCTPAVKPYIELNWNLTTQLNRRDGWNWIVVDNSEEPSASLSKFGDDRCEIIEGVGSDKAIPEGRRGSYHHAAALNKAMMHIRTRFVLILDPDFYIVVRGWADRVISHMMKNDLAFFGAPYNPRWYTKYRYFPCAHCLFVDLSKVPTEALDFTPEIVAKAKNAHRSANKPGLRCWMTPNVFGALRLIGKRTPLKVLMSRNSVGWSRDTGYRIFERYGQNGPARFECEVPVFRPEADFQGPEYALSWYGRLFERLLPDRLCYLPKRSNYSTTTGFRELDHVDVTSKGWEEYIWQGQPFGFHIRSHRQTERDPEEDMVMVTRVLESFPPTGAVARAR